MNPRATFDLNADAIYQHTVKQYLVNPPGLVRRALDGCYGEKKTRLIALELDISQPHVERIVARARAFCGATLRTAAEFPVVSCRAVWKVVEK